MKLRSQNILKRPEWSINRAYYKCMGYTDSNLEKPLIGIANAWSTTVPGHSNLRQVAESVKAGIWSSGGTPVEFGVIGACDGIAGRQCHQNTCRTIQRDRRPGRALRQPGATIGNHQTGCH
ncbi:MAG: dihydroxy-acid dehydratase [Desulfopila sp.]